MDKIRITQQCLFLESKSRTNNRPTSLRVEEWRSCVSYLLFSPTLCGPQDYKLQAKRKNAFLIFLEAFFSDRHQLKSDSNSNHINPVTIQDFDFQDFNRRLLTNGSTQTSRRSDTFGRLFVCQVRTLEFWDCCDCHACAGDCLLCKLNRYMLKMGKVISRVAITESFFT